MVKMIRTSSDNQDFIRLVKQLDADLAERDGNDHSFYAQFNKIDTIKHAVVAYENGQPAGCGAIKEYAPGVMEVKRMYTSPGSRGKGIATRVLTELEIWAAELSCPKCVLETGKRQPEAIELYKKNGYNLIPNYGQYAEVENSVCFEKDLKSAGMNKQHQYQLTVKWTGNTGNGTSGYRNYERSHAILAGNKAEIGGSSDPAFRGDKTKHNPEELFLASLSACHMLMYLHLCAEAGVIVTGYTDRATGILQETADGGGHFTEVTLNPEVIVGEASMIGKANELHHKANSLCFIAASCNFPVRHAPACRAI